MGSADSPRRVCWSRTVRGASTEGLLLLVRYWRFASHFRTVRRYLADGPPWARGQSAWYCTGLLSPLLLDSCLRFGIVWGLFLGLVGPL
jgi:hypothetical protein